MAREMKAFPPWPVYALVLLGVGGLAWSTLVDPERNLWDAAIGLFTLWISYSLWAGKPWAYSLSFALATLCGAFLAVYVIVYLLLGHGVQWWPISTIIWAVVEILLLLHPATERFRRLHEKDQPDVAKV